MAPENSAFDAIAPGPVRRANTYDLIANSVIELVREGRLKPGDALPPERELVDRFGAGRSSVREAMRVLESRGLVTGERGSFRVADPTEALSSSFQLLMQITRGRIGDLLELRRMIEVETAGNAALHRTAADVEDLRELNVRWHEILAGSLGSRAEYEEASSADLRFHLRIAETAGNSTIVSVLHAMRVVAGHIYEKSISIPDIRDVVADQHEAIIEAIAAGDKLGAEEALRAHVIHVEDSLGSVLDRPLYE